MIKHCFISVLIFLCIATLGQAQSRQDAEETYKDANAYFYFEDYEEALALYLSIYDEFPANANLDYRIGICYLNVAGSKDRAIHYLERAVGNISPRYSENSIREDRAPIEALFYLGNAYFVNNKLTKAEQAYQDFRSNIRRERQYDMNYLNHQVEAIERSRVIQNYPVDFLRNNLGSDINNKFPNYNPVVSGDGNTLAYTTNERFYQAIMVAKKFGDKWGRPRNITLDLVVNGNCKTLSLSYDGTELYLFKDDEHVGNIYVSQFVDEAWSPMRKLNENINTEFYETHACISSDGKKLFFASNRSGGYGDLDIYVSERNSNGEWGPAKNLGSKINTRFNENTPFVTVDGKTLFFSSDGHHGVGGYDIFFSILQADKTWSQPVNLGYPINTADDNMFYQPVDDGAVGLMAVFDPHGYGDKDITQVEIFLPKYQRSIVASGDYFARKSELPARTLVVDTVNIAGVALLDPNKPENKDYLDSGLEYTLFFDGKPYVLKDQSKELKALISRSSSIASTDTLVQTSPQEPFAELMQTIDNEQEIQQVEESLKADSVIQHPENRQEQRQIDEVSPADSTIQPSKLRDELKMAQETSRNIMFRELLTSVADPNIKVFIDEVMVGNWDLPPDLLFARVRQLVYQADSLGNTEFVIEALAKLMDLLSTKAVEVKYQKSRKISQTSYDEDFFYRLQKLKRKASPELVALFDEAILTQPHIASFASLWDYLLTHKYQQIEPYLGELLSLLAENTIGGYFDLGEHEQNELLQSTQGRKFVFSSTFITIGLAVLLGLLILLWLKRNRKT